MKHSEFWDSLNQVFGSAYGRTLVQDLVIESLHGTAAQALERGEDPNRVWQALIEETAASPEARWIHRAEKSRKNPPASSV